MLNWSKIILRHSVHKEYICNKWIRSVGYTNVMGNAKKTTTVNKVNDSDIIPTAHSSTFSFCRHANPKQKTKRA